MQQVILETKNGEFVARRQIPPFRTPPDVLVWGQRVFMLRARLHTKWIYREVSMFAIIDKEEVNK